MKELLTVAAVLILTACVCGESFAFHSGGVAECEGCHTMHNSFEGAAAGAGAAGQANAFLLKGTDQSSTCLNCHNAADTSPNSYHISTDASLLSSGTPPVELTPGGDFAWLKKDYTWVPRSGASPENSKGERHGHNIIAADYGYAQDSTQVAAPGGSYPSAKLHCSSCHDPHGKYRITSVSGNTITFATTGKPIKSSSSYGDAPDATSATGAYRLLAGIGYQPKSLSGSYAFTQNPPTAVAPKTYNRSEAASDTRVAYGKYTGEWCANCHEGMHSYLSGNLVHKAGETLGSEIAGIYNRYKKSGDLTGSSSTAYLSLVPFQMDNTADLTSLKNATTSTAGPSSNDRVICMTCHRAHASGFDSMTRFGLGNEFITVASSSGGAIYPDPAESPAQAQGRSASETQQAYYDRPATAFAPNQRNLCNKCHAKD